MIMLAPLAIGCIGMYIILSYEVDRVFRLSMAVYGLSVSLSIDNIIAGVGPGIAVGFDTIIIFIIITGIVSLFTSIVGFKLGNAILNHLNIKSEFYSGIMLLLVSLAFLFFEL
jgi:putative Mn2+ efflux pump MntP